MPDHDNRCRTRAARCGAVILPAAALALLAGCVPYEAPLTMDLQRLSDRAAEPVDQAGLAIGETDPTSVEDATGAFLEEIQDEDRGDPGESIPISLDELRRSVLQNNLDLAVVRFDPQTAEESLNAERAKFDAIFVADASYLDAEFPTGNTTLFGLSSPDPALSGTRGAFTELEQDREKFNAGVGLAVPLPTGGVIGIVQDFEIDDKSAIGVSSTEDRAETRFSISQPLLRGGGVFANTASIRLARLSLGATEAETRLTVIRVLASAEKAYWRLWAAQRVLEVQQQQLQLARNNYELVTRRIEEGLNAAVERFSAELAVAQQIEGLVVAETNVRLRARELSRVLNRTDLPVGITAPIEVTSDPRLTRFELDRDELVARALDERLELLELELKLASDAIKIGLARNAALPVFIVDFEFGLGDRQGTIASSFADSYDFENPSFAIGGRASIPITNDAAEARVRRSVLSRMQRLASRDQKRLAIRQEVHDAADVLDQNWQRILAARQNVIAATGNYQAEQQLFTDGLASAQDVLIAFQQLGSARQREVSVIAAYQSAQIDLAFATGVLLGYSNAVVDPDGP
ncbi:MAG: TolC family protein [Planctomycetota bacterium]